MPSWWGKSSSKEVKKKTNKESIFDTLHRKFKIPSEEKGSNRSCGSRRRNSDTISEKGSRSRAESRSPSPSTEVSRCQSFAERPHAQPLPLPGIHPACIGRTDSGISVTKPGLEKCVKPSLYTLPKPGCIQHRSDVTDVDGDLATASISSDCSIDSDDPADSRHLSPQTTDNENGTRTAVNSPSSESGEMCAMKEVTLFSDDAKSRESAKQLCQEISLLSRLRHPNIVQYYGSETVDDKLYIYLEFVSGGSIYKLLQDYGQLGEVAIRSYTQQILSGLAYLHAKNTVHRDIKGANILVDPNGRRVKLADFGMAKHITGQSCPLSFKGSPYWMAPEVIKNSNGCNLAVDIWSLGCTVLEMATTKPPWSQYEGVAAMFKIGNSKELPAIPEHLSEEGKDFVRKCLQRNPLLRPTAAQLLEHPFVKNVAPLEKPIVESPEAHLGVVNAVKSLGIGHTRNLSSLDSEGLGHQSRGLKNGSTSSDSHITRNISCPVSPIGSPLLHSRSPQHVNGRMSPSPISSPRTMSGSSTPLTGGNGAVPFHHPKQSSYLHEGFGNMPRSPNNPYVNGATAYHDPRPDLFRGMQPGPRIFPDLISSENDALGKQFGRPVHGDSRELYDGQSVLADRVSQQLLRDHVKSNPSLDLSPGSQMLGRTSGI